MIVRLALISAMLVGASQVAFAQSDEAACRPDVRRYCSDVKQGSGNNVYLACLQSNRDSLSSSCRKVLERNGK